MHRPSIHFFGSKPSFGEFFLQEINFPLKIYNCRKKYTFSSHSIRKILYQLFLSFIYICMSFLFAVCFRTSTSAVEMSHGLISSVKIEWFQFFDVCFTQPTKFNNWRLKVHWVKITSNHTCRRKVLWSNYPYSVIYLS